MSLCRTFSRLSIYAKHFRIQQPGFKQNPINRYSENFNTNVNKNGIHTTCTRKDLMEFFDDKENWTEREVRVGRSWRIEELRIKSNSDLHKLWYVLLKEKNMLLTMEHEYRRLGRAMPNPERLDKVEESMENLEAVVRERNRAYFELETGETGERPTGMDTDCFGLEYKYKMREHLIEKRVNKKYWENKKLYNFTDDHKYVADFLTRLEEKKRRMAIAKNKKRYKYACKLLEIFPNLDEEALKKEFPDLDIEKVKKDKRSRSHQENAY